MLIKFVPTKGDADPPEQVPWNGGEEGQAGERGREWEIVGRGNLLEKLRGRGQQRRHWRGRSTWSQEDFCCIDHFRCFVSSCGNYWSIFESHGQSRSRAVGDTGDVAERGWRGWTGERGGGLASDGVQACVCHCARRESGSMALVPVFSYRRVYGWWREAEGATVGCLHRYRPRFPGSACSASMLPASNFSFSWFLKTDSAQLKPQLDRTSRGWPSPPVGVWARV